MQANLVELDEAIMDAELERVVNLLDPEERKYASEAGLTDILAL